ncbi:uncharacterized protein TrAtP1_003275 [Trichoderma atroviride]|uniref:uncharacterized protein n=1 Tax=Hypocrea atroviridis TaxID=63577 RepID=UPI003328336F|nr:hypothetical protein TrAtP1_003275 [Trichoderma atroviride]
MSAPSSIAQTLWATQIPPARYSPILAHHALHHQRPPLQLPVTAAATPLRLL